MAVSAADVFSCKFRESNSYEEPRVLLRHNVATRRGNRERGIRIAAYEKMAVKCKELSPRLTDSSLSIVEPSCSAFGCSRTNVHALV